MLMVSSISLPIVLNHKPQPPPQNGRGLEKERNREREEEGRQKAGREVCDTTDTLRKLRFSANFSDHKRASGSRLRARGLGRPRNSASGSHVLVAREVCFLPDPEFTL